MATDRPSTVSALLLSTVAVEHAATPECDRTPHAVVNAFGGLVQELGE